jgi:FtsP/CotA-like multicopper oxidase with cupredoxin domain
MEGISGAMELMNGWLGDRLLVNGRVTPTFQVDRRTYRVRLLNGSNARIFKLAWSNGAPMTVIGGDGGLLERARALPAVTLAPGQRVDALLDLSEQSLGSEVRLVSVAFPSAAAGRVGMMGGPPPLPQGAPVNLMTLRVSGPQRPRYRVPRQFSSDGFRPAASAPTRRVPLTFAMMNFFLDGRTFGLEDTVLVLPGETVRVQVTFSRHPGLFLYHCHILEHEDMGMMRNFRIRG